MKINKSIIINCKPQELWRWLTEFEKLRKWNKSIVEQQYISSGEVGPGYLTKVLIEEGKKRVWYENEILEYQPNKLLTISLKGGSLGKAPMVIEYEVKEQDSQLELSYKSTWKPVGLLLMLLHPLIKKMSNKNVDNALLTLKQQIEIQKE